MMFVVWKVFLIIFILMAIFVAPVVVLVCWLFTFWSSDPEFWGFVILIIFAMWTIGCVLFAIDTIWMISQDNKKG